MASQIAQYVCKVWATILLLSSGMISGVTVAQSLPEPACRDNFDSFAYRAPERDLSRITPTIFPASPWSLAATVPVNLLVDLQSVQNTQPHIYAGVRASRRYNDQHELWVGVSITAPNYRSSSLFVYHPHSGDWQLVDNTLEDSNVYLSSFFVAPDGSIWASNQWLDSAMPDANSVPALSRFNETTRQFEYVTNSPQVPVVDRRSINANLRPQVVMDQNGIFWIFNANNSIYHYDPAADVSEQRLDITASAPKGIDYAVLAPDGTIYFSQYVGPGLPDLSDDAIFQYRPQTNELTSIPLPQEPWTQFTSLFVDSRNWLWLGANGYRDETGVWHLLHTAVEEYFESQGFRYQAPNIFSETSDGRLWTNRFETYEGTAWFNPVTGEGCQITSSLITVFEDIEGYVWMGAGTEGQLYRYQAAPPQ